MRLPDFKLERFFAQWEFEVPFILCASDVETLPLRELLDLADDETRGLWEDLSLGYTESTGHPILRLAISELYEEVTPEDVLVFSGAEEAIFVVLNSLVGTGDHVIVHWPGYQSLHEVADASGAEVSLLRVDHEDAWTFDVDDVLGLIRPNTKLIAINLPHNPTGALIDRDVFIRLLDSAKERGIIVFSDEVYRLLEFDADRRLPAAADVDGDAVSLGVMSKSFGLAGLRIGWIATRNRDVLGRAAALKDYTTICNSAPSEVLAIMALRARDAILERNRAIVDANLRQLDDFFDRHDDKLEWVRPQAGSIAFPRLIDGRPMDRFAQELAAREGVLLLPGSIFDYPGNHFRLGFGRSDLPEALDRFERFLR
jgi:aspartate/methionine/tyrosine aminotransferase